jgi:hypothetical protein
LVLPMKKLRADFSVIERIFVVSLPTSFSILGSWAQNVRDLWDEVHTKRFCPQRKYKTFNEKGHWDSVGQCIG